jgi:hypothetical protein
MADADTPPPSPPPPFVAAGDEPADSAPAPGVVMPLTKEAIEKFLRFVPLLVFGMQTVRACCAG